MASPSGNHIRQRRRRTRSAAPDSEFMQETKFVVLKFLQNASSGNNRAKTVGTKVSLGKSPIASPAVRPKTKSPSKAKKVALVFQEQAGTSFNTQKEGEVPVAEPEFLAILRMSGDAWDDEAQVGNQQISEADLEAVAEEVARRLACFGDEAQQRYFEHLNMAEAMLTDICTGFITYQNFSDAAALVLDDSSLTSWQQVTAVLLFSHRVAVNLAKFGHQSVDNIVNHTTTLLAEKAASFILDQGGWDAVISLDPPDSNVGTQDSSLPCTCTGTSSLPCTCTGTSSKVATSSRLASHLAVSVVLVAVGVAILLKFARG